MKGIIQDISLNHKLRHIFAAAFTPSIVVLVAAVALRVLIEPPQEVIMSTTIPEELIAIGIISFVNGLLVAGLFGYLRTTTSLEAISVSPILYHIAIILACIVYIYSIWGVGYEVYTPTVDGGFVALFLPVVYFYGAMIWAAFLAVSALFHRVNKRK